MWPNLAVTVVLRTNCLYSLLLVIYMYSVYSIVDPNFDTIVINQLHCESACYIEVGPLHLA